MPATESEVVSRSVRRSHDLRLTLTTHAVVRPGSARNRAAGDRGLRALRRGGLHPSVTADFPRTCRAAVDDRGAGAGAISGGETAALHGSDGKDAATVAGAGGVCARGAASRLLPDQPHQMLPRPGDRNSGKGGSAAVGQGDRALRAASGPGDRAGAAADRRRAGATGRGAPRSDGAGSTPDRSRGEPPSGGARGARLSSAASATSFRCLALVE